MTAPIAPTQFWTRPSLLRALGRTLFLSYGCSSVDSAESVAVPIRRASRRRNCLRTFRGTSVSPTRLRMLRRAISSQKKWPRLASMKCRYRRSNGDQTRLLRWSSIAITPNRHQSIRSWSHGSCPKVFVRASGGWLLLTLSQFWTPVGRIA